MMGNTTFRNFHKSNLRLCSQFYRRRETPSEKTVKLYLRLPVKIVDEQQVKDLHPGIVEVKLPRQKSRRWCIVEFESTSAKSGIKALKAVKVENKRVFVSAHKTAKASAESQ